ncbi:MAG: DNA-deoxyinosine glycosylase [Lachnospiraceae bacterium]|nr:DNA-deoxyinosine glycosylase [Lachnospiraceae bacterium]
MREYQHITHEFAPIYDENSKILILGSLPSVKSRENNFYYGHPQNRFWKVIAKVCQCPCPENIEAKKKMLLEHQIAIWDVIAECDIIGSSDSSIRNVKANDISKLISDSRITGIYVNGATAGKYYKKYVQEQICREAILLPSTSPANAAYSLKKLCEIWHCILECP